MPGATVTGGPPGGVAAPARPTPEPDTWATVAPPAGAAELRVDASELEQMTTIEFAPPSGLSPAHGGIVLREEVRPEHKVAWLIQAAIDGVVELDDREGTRLTRVAGAPAAPDQQTVFSQMFTSGPTLELGSYDRSFATGWSTLGTQLSSWRAQSGLWDTRADGRRITAMVLGVVAALAGAVAALAGGAMAGLRQGGPLWLVLAVAGGLLAGAGLATAVGGWELRVRTAAGSALWLRVESFRRFLAESEGYHADEAAKRGVLREYTAWAVAVGEIGRWTQAVSTSTIAPQVAGVHYAYMAPYLARLDGEHLHRSVVQRQRWRVRWRVRRRLGRRRCRRRRRRQLVATGARPGAGRATAPPGRRGSDGAGWRNPALVVPGGGRTRDRPEQ